jgi:hypothetical protein
VSQKFTPKSFINFTFLSNGNLSGSLGHVVAHVNTRQPYDHLQPSERDPRLRQRRRDIYNIPSRPKPSELPLSPVGAMVGGVEQTALQIIVLVSLFSSYLACTDAVGCRCTWIQNSARHSSACLSSLLIRNPLSFGLLFDQDSHVCLRSRFVSSWT